MKRLTKLLPIAAAIALASAPLVFAQTFQTSNGREQRQRVLNGIVKNKGEQILPGAIVYLKNMKTVSVKSYIADDKGEFHFHSLSPDVDYQVYAEYKGVRSQTKTLSSFDSRAVFNMDLQIDAGK